MILKPVNLKIQTMENTISHDKPRRKLGERIRITGELFIDYKAFQKTPAERLVLKIAKAKYKDYVRSKKH